MSHDDDVTASFSAGTAALGLHLITFETIRHLNILTRVWVMFVRLGRWCSDFVN